MSRSLARGLEILEFLNLHRAASVAEISKSLAIPRASAYRLLASLVDRGFVAHHKSENCYRPLRRVRGLGDQYSEIDHLGEISRELLSQITRSYGWPLLLGTLSGVDVVVQQSTDSESDVPLEHFKTGYRIPLMRSASGRCMLAYMRGRGPLLCHSVAGRF